MYKLLPGGLNSLYEPGVGVIFTERVQGAEQGKGLRDMMKILNSYCGKGQENWLETRGSWAH